MVFFVLFFKIQIDYMIVPFFAWSHHNFLNGCQLIVTIESFCDCSISEIAFVIPKLVVTKIARNVLKPEIKYSFFSFASRADDHLVDESSKAKRHRQKKL